MSSLCIGIRIHAENNRPLQEYYLDNMLHWIEYRKYDSPTYVAGIHLETENPHIHIHIITKGKALSNPIATMKRDYQMGKVPTSVPGYKDYEYPESVIGQTYKGRINMSIQMTELEENESLQQNITRFLQYPLKEGLELRSNIDTKELKENAMKEYKESKEKHERLKTEKQKKEAKELSEWVKFSNYLDEQQPINLEEAFRHAIHYYRTNYDKPPTGKLMIDNAERYCIKHGILSYEDLVQKYIGRY